MRKEFVYRKKLEFYRTQYEDLCNRRTLLFSSIGDEDSYSIREYALNFLVGLKIFKKAVPNRVIRERFEDFRDAKDLAQEVLKF